jgi:hypothetical protein
LGPGFRYKLTIRIFRRLERHLPSDHGDAVLARVALPFDNLFLLVVQDQLDALEDVAVLGMLAALQNRGTIRP